MGLFYKSETLVGIAMKFKKKKNSQQMNDTSGVDCTATTTNSHHHCHHRRNDLIQHGLQQVKQKMEP